MAHKQVFWASLTVSHAEASMYVVEDPKKNRYYIYQSDMLEIIKEKVIDFGQFTGWFRRLHDCDYIIRLAEDSEIPED